MVVTAPRAFAASRHLDRISTRTRFRWSGAAADVVAVATAYTAAVAVRAYAMPAIGLPPAPFAPDLSLVILVATTLSVFHASGLYELEAYVSRPLHLWTLLKASLVAFAIAIIVISAIKLDAFDTPRLVLLMTFVGFVLFGSVLRIGVLDGLHSASMRRHRPVSFLLGDSPAANALDERLGHLRGFDRVRRATPAALRLGMADALGTMIEGPPSTEEGAVSVFIDAASGTARETFEAAAAAQALGADVYVISALLESLEGNRLLSMLFGMPVIRVRGSVDDAKPYALKRAFDIVGSAALLLASLPVMAVLGLIIRLTSPGPVFYKQTRVGRSGVPFEFLKLRSMVMNRDASIHSEYVRAFINGTAEAVAAGPDGAMVFKRVDDPRITPVGRFIRKFSLDEIPQFWNVFRGDMSLVGPRPPLPYEVSEYDDWHSLRLTVPCGVTGLWQTEGRSRVSFDEMILQDLMYAQNMRLLVDVKLCLKTVPATLLGDGAG